MSDETSTVQGTLPSRVNSVLANRYRLVRRLGIGGMGEVYEAVHLAIPKRFAVKLLRAEYAEDAQMRARFHGEAEAAASLTSDHIVQVLDFGHAEDGSPYLVMELLEGSDLRRTMKERGPLSIGEVSAIVMQACEGAQVAHEHGIVHRDLKPENLFLARRGEQYIVKVLDFGIAKLRAHGASTANGKLLGTPAYMSPEQARGAKDVDARTDVLALGVVLYEALSGRLPHPGEGPHEIITHLLFSEPEPLRKWNPDVPDTLSEVVHKALRADLALRYPTVTALRSALAPFADRSYARGALSLGDEQAATLPARDSEVRSEVPQVGRTGARTAHTASGPLRALAFLALGAAVLLGAIAPWQPRNEPAPTGVPSRPIAKTDPVHMEPPALSSPEPREPVAVGPPAPVAALDASAPAAARPVEASRRSLGSARNLDRPAIPAPSEQDMPTPSPAAEAQAALPEPSTFEVKRGKQTLVFMRDNPLRK